MFKPLLRTLPTLSGNYTIACKIDELSKLNSNDYEVYIREASLMPLQNNVFNKNIGLNLVKDQHEYVLSKYFNKYSNIFYKENYTYDKNNYREYDEYEVNRTNDSRNKDYEFGCKRLYYSQNNYQFSFYAPFYIDDVNDLPEYFVINIDITNHVRKTIKIYLNKDSYSNYLKTYLKKYINNIDNKVIFCSPEHKQATYFGIDVKNGGLVKYIDNIVGDLYINQNTINNFDYTICKGFERNNLVMSQIIPLSFMFNINDLFDENERKFFNSHEAYISGYYYNRFNLKQNFYDFSINYYNFYQKFLKYNENSGQYVMDYAYLNDDKMNIMNISYPSLNEGRFTKYRFTNKITPIYCRFKLLYSDDSNPYITNMSYAYSYLQNPNIKYGEFPTMFKDIYPTAVIKDDSLVLPIGNNINKYYTTNNYNKYKTLMDNFYSSWYNVLNVNENIFNENNYWCNIINKHAYFNGVLYKLTDDITDDIDKFGVFINLSMNNIDSNTAINDIIGVKYILSKEDIGEKTTIKMNNIGYKNSYLNEIFVDKYTTETVLNDNSTYGLYIYEQNFNYLQDNGELGSIFMIDNIEGYGGKSKLDDIEKYVEFNIDNETISYNHNIYYTNTNKSDYLTFNKKLIKDTYGSYILESDYYKNNKYYKYNDIINLLISINDELLTEEINNITIKLQKELDKIKVIGYELLPIYDNSNIYQYSKIGDADHYSLIFDDNKFSNIYDNLYIETTFSSSRTQLKNVRDILINKDNNNNIKIYYRDYFISEENLFATLINNENLLVDSTNINNVYWTNTTYNISLFRNTITKTNKEEMFKKISLYANNPSDNKYYLGTIGVTKDQIYESIDKCEEYIRENYEELKPEKRNLTFSTYRKIFNKYITGITVNDSERIIYRIINIYFELFDNIDDIKDPTELNQKSINQVITLINNHLTLFELMLKTLNIFNHEQFYLSPRNYKNGELIYKMPYSHYIYKKISDLTLYSFCPYSLDNNIISYNYFIKNKDIYDNSIYVDTYHLNEYIHQYNKRTNSSIPYIDDNSEYKFKNFYYRIINRNHIKEYVNELINYVDYGIINKKKIDYSINILKYIYVKSRIYLINKQTNSIDIKDKYILLKDYLFEKYDDYEYVKYLKRLYNIQFNNESEEQNVENTNNVNEEDNLGVFNVTDSNDLFINIMCSENRNMNDKFTISLDSMTTIEVDLSFNKYFIQMNDHLIKLLKDDKTYLYLYKCNDSYIDKNNWGIEEIESIEEINDKEEIKQSDNESNSSNEVTSADLITYYNECIKNASDENLVNVKEIGTIVDINNYLVPLFNDIYLNESDSLTINNLIKYNKINKTYVDTNEIYAKQIDVISYIRSYIEYNDLQDIVNESLEELGITNGSIEDIENNEEYYRNIFIKEKLGISLYKIYNNNIISLNKNINDIFSNDQINQYQITYNENSNLYFAKDQNNYKYAFYIIDFNFDNTNNSFNLNNTYDISISFNQINNIDISPRCVNEYFKIINPFLKTNIFRTFVNLKINNIIKQNELNMYINYISTKIKPDEEYKYISLKNNNDDLIYDNIIKYQKNKQIMMLRYFNFITPLLEEKTILNDIWENLFITNDNYSQKYNVLYKNDINIYKYHPIHLCTQYDYVNNKEISYEDIYQKEYKHFNNNKLYNLKEEIIITLDKEITYDELINIYETKEKTIEVFSNYINNIFKKKLNTNIILFLYNKYNVSYLSKSSKLNSIKTSKLYKISYKFNLK